MLADLQSEFVYFTFWAVISAFIDGNFFQAAQHVMLCQYAAVAADAENKAAQDSIYNRVVEAVGEERHAYCCGGECAKVHADSKCTLCQ